MWALAILAVLGLLFDVILHVATFVGCNPQDWIQPDWSARLIVIGLFLVIAIPAIVIADRRKKRERQTGIEWEEKNPFWFALIIKLAVCYAVFCFFNYGILDLRRAGGEPQRAGVGVYVVDPGHGHPARSITKDEFDRLRRREVRGGTGFFLMFYLQIAFDLCGLGRRQVRVRPVRRVYVMSIHRQVFRL